MNPRILLLNGINPPWIFRQLRFRRGARSSVGNKATTEERGGPKLSKSDEIQIQNLTKIFDETLYHDGDFDYIDHRKDHKGKPKFKLEAKSLKFIPKDELENVLYHQDFTDNYLPTYLNRKKKNINRLPEKLIKSSKVIKQNLDENERKVLKMESRKLYPLPFNINQENRFEILNQTIAPLAKYPYEEQLIYKYNKNKKILKALGAKLKLSNSPIRFPQSGLPCPLAEVVPSSIISHYRNKDEFTVWPGLDGNTKTVGFTVGQTSKHENVYCIEPDQTILTKASHIEIAHKFQDYLRNVSHLDYCQNYGLKGNWRRLTVRSNDAGNIMMIANMHPQQLSQEMLDEESQKLRNYFENIVDSLYISFSENIRTTHSKSKEKIVHLSGSETIVERLFDKQFEISPGSFFQINRIAAESLYHSILEELNLENNDIFLDLCCGNGSVAILASKYCDKVIGIDWTEASIKDAIRNAELNNIHNIDFVCARIEEFLPKLQKDLDSNRRIIVSINPSRRGVTTGLINTLRNMKNLFKVVFVSCKAEAESFNNMTQLCGVTHNKHVDRFVPVNAIPVDLFPHTEHCELVVTFERL